VTGHCKSASGVATGSPRHPATRCGHCRVCLWFVPGPALVSLPTPRHPFGCACFWQSTLVYPPSFFCAPPPGVHHPPARRPARCRLFWPDPGLPHHRFGLLNITSLSGRSIPSALHPPPLNYPGRLSVFWLSGRQLLDCCRIICWRPSAIAPPCYIARLAYSAVWPDFCARLPPCSLPSRALAGMFLPRTYPSRPWGPRPAPPQSLEVPHLT
jgi:hypothetical protein